MQQDDTARDCPYRGLEPFDERDAAFFFGREREARLIAASLFAAPLTLLYGASGVGKSSVLRAGVLPRLRERRDLLPVVFPTIQRMSGSTVLRGWQSDALGGIKETVAVAMYESAGDDSASRASFQDAVLANEMAPLRPFLTACHAVTGRRIMLILDQFEEYSLYHPEDDDFGKQFPDAIVPGDLSVSFLISLREDSLAKLDRFKGRIPTLWDSYRRVDHLDRKAAEDAIRLPLKEYGKQNPDTILTWIEDPLVDAVLSEVQTESVQFEETGSGTLGAAAGGRIETPYLQLVMTRLWERERQQNSDTLRLATLREEGGAAEIVRTHLDRVMSHFTPEDRDIAARVFHRLVTPSGAKIAFSVRDLADYEGIDPALLAPILRQLEEGSRRILRRVASRADIAEEPRYEIFHDRLGKAILAWRAKRLQEQEREKRQREEVEQKRLAEQTRASFRKQIESAMYQLGPEGQAVWSRMLFYLVTTDGRRLAQNATDLAKLAELRPDRVQTVLQQLVSLDVLRSAYRSTSSPEPFYEVSHDAMASVLLEWHSQYVLRGGESMKAGQTAAAFADKEFPYGMVRQRFQNGEIIPFLGAGASLSASPPKPGSGRKGPPAGRELKEMMARRCDFPATEFDHSDVAEVASFFVQRLGREALDAFLQEQLGTGEFTPGETHRFLAQAARLKPLLILTTNYDTLMEQALDEVGATYETIALLRESEGDKGMLAVTGYRNSQPDFVVASRLQERFQTVVFRLNGPAVAQGKPAGSYSVTEEDQIDWILRLRSTLPPFAVRDLNRWPLLSLGHSARDWSQRALLRTLYDKRQKRGSSWAVALNPAPLSVMTWQRYGVEVYNVDLNEWSKRMRGATAA